MTYSTLFDQRTATRLNKYRQCAGCEIFLDDLLPGEKVVKIAGMKWCTECAQRRRLGIPVWGTWNVPVDYMDISNCCGSDLFYQVDDMGRCSKCGESCAVERIFI